VLPLARRSVGGGADSTVGDGADYLAGGTACYGLFECSCGQFIAIGALEPHFWHALCSVTGVEGSLADALANPEAGGGGRRSALSEAMAAALRTKPAKVWEVAMVQAGVPATIVVEPEESAAHVEALTGTPVELEVSMRAGDSSSELMRLPRLPLCLGTPSCHPGPRLGEHNDALE
jgi:crotonobetainyl-CoA:carnitine CoA-transferase CaiB-like acyl-CoA transferase